MQRITMWLLRIGIVGAIAVLLYILFLFWTDVVHAAESDSLYFVSATDMIAQVNSVIDVCDTVWVDTTDGQIGYIDSPYQGKSYSGVGFSTEFDGEIKGKMRFVTQTNLLDDKLETRYSPPIITCRELIDVEVIIQPDSERVWENILVKNPQGKLEINGEKYSIVNYALIPGQMVVWWREVVQ